MSGRVEDYLNYRNCSEMNEDVIEEQKDHGRVSNCDRDGVNNHAYIGI